MVDPQFHDTCAHRLVIAKVANNNPVKPGRDALHGHTVTQGKKPLPKRLLPGFIGVVAQLIFGVPHAQMYHMRYK